MPSLPVRYPSIEADLNSLAHSSAVVMLLGLSVFSSMGFPSFPLIYVIDKHLLRFYVFLLAAVRLVRHGTLQKGGHLFLYQDPFSGSIASFP